MPALLHSQQVHHQSLSSTLFLMLSVSPTSCPYVPASSANIPSGSHFPSSQWQTRQRANTKTVRQTHAACCMVLAAPCRCKQSKAKAKEHKSVSQLHSIIQVMNNTGLFYVLINMQLTNCTDERFVMFVFYLYTSYGKWQKQSLGKGKELHYSIQAREIELSESAHKWYEN